MSKILCVIGINEQRATTNKPFHIICTLAMFTICSNTDHKFLPLHLLAVEVIRGSRDTIGIGGLKTMTQNVYSQLLKTVHS